MELKWARSIATKGGRSLIMIDHSARQFMLAQRRYQQKRLSMQEIDKIEAVTARSFTDDVDPRRGALSAPRFNFRPGQRDDAPHCSFVGTIPIM